MILAFPNFETLQLAMTSAIVPEEVLRLPASTASVGEAIYVQSRVKLPRKASKELKKLGVEVVRKTPIELTRDVICWHQMVPLVRTSNAAAVDDKTVVLFATKTQGKLAELVSEMMRLGNDRQSFRYLTNETNDSETQALLRVIGPPYYSLLRAIDANSPRELNLNATEDHALAFVESSARVWVQFGFQHPLPEQVQAPVGQQLFMQANGNWSLVDEAPFQDIYKALQTTLPSAPIQMADTGLPSKIPIKLGLADAASNDAAELWVIQRNAMQQVEALVHRSDDELLSRLSFAISESGENTTAIIRTRPSKKRPPCLILDAIAYRCYWKLPNLFLPIGKRLHPPLRRDAVADLLAKDRQMISWLEPSTDSGTFQKYSIEDSAFQPLSNWVEYVMDHEAESLEAWANSFQFEFDRFVCKEDTPRKTKPRSDDRNLAKSSSDQKASNEQTVREASPKYDVEHRSLEIDSPSPTTGPDQISQDQLQLQLEQLEDQFNHLDESVDSASRTEIWRQMAPLNSKLGRRHDSTVCWSNAHWESVDDHYQAWLVCETETSQIGSTDDVKLKALISDKSNRPTDISLIAAYLGWASMQSERPQFVAENFSELNQYLHRQEGFLPVRTAWIAWSSMYRLSDGDELLLARARDRILERLFQTGLTPEYDMPSFLRLQSGSQNDRHRLLGEQIRNLGEAAEQWLEKSRGVGAQETKHYAKLMFAFAHARLGDTTFAQAILEEATFALDDTADGIHKWLAKAFEERVVQALNAEPSTNPFSERLVEAVDGMPRMERYKVDRLRQQSYILEPVEQIDPFTRWDNTYADELSRQLSELQTLQDRDELRSSITRLLKKHDADSTRYSRVLATGLQLAPRTGEKFSLNLVTQVIPSLKRSKDAVENALLLQKSLYVSAHFGRGDLVLSLIRHFEKALPKIVTSYLGLQIQHSDENFQKVNTIESLFTESFHELRKLGMRDEIGRLYEEIQGLIRKNAAAGRKKRTTKNAKIEIDATRPLRLLLCVAAGWYYFGRIEDANLIADQVQTILLDNELTPLEQKSLASAYINAVAMAPPEQANSRIAQLFEMNSHGEPRLQNIKDNMTTSSHYSISQLALIESTVLALVNDEYSLNAESRRWLDEDEFLVRSRIHRDVQQATQQKLP